MPTPVLNYIRLFYVPTMVPALVTDDIVTLTVALSNTDKHILFNELNICPIRRNIFVRAAFEYIASSSNTKLSLEYTKLLMKYCNRSNTNEL